MLIYSLIRSIGIVDNNGDWECLKEEVVYVTSSSADFFMNYDVSIDKLENLKIGDCVNLEAMTKKIKSDVNIEIMYLVEKKEIKVD